MSLPGLPVERGIGSADRVFLKYSGEHAWWHDPALQWCNETHGTVWFKDEDEKAGR